MQESYALRDPEKPRFDLSTIMGIRVNLVDVPADASEMAKEYIDHLRGKSGVEMTKPQAAELAWAFRRQLQEDMKVRPARGSRQGTYGRRVACLFPCRLS